MENVENLAVEEVKAVPVVNVESVEGDKSMENTTTAVKTVVSAVKNFEVTRIEGVSKYGRAYDCLEVSFEGKPERVIIDRIKAKGFTYNFKNHNWGTFAFNSSKDTSRSGKEDEAIQCKMFIESVLAEPFTEEQNEQAKAEAKERNKEWRENHPGKVAKSESTKSSKSTGKSKEKAKTSVKKDSKPKSETAKPAADMDKILLRAFLLSKGITDTKTLSADDKVKLLNDFDEYKKALGV